MKEDAAFLKAKPFEVKELLPAGVHYGWVSAEDYKLMSENSHHTVKILAEPIDSTYVKVEIVLSYPVYQFSIDLEDS